MISLHKIHLHTVKIDNHFHWFMIEPCGRLMVTFTSISPVCWLFFFRYSCRFIQFSMLPDLTWSQTKPPWNEPLVCYLYISQGILAEEAYVWVTWASLRLYPTAWIFLHREQDASQEAVNCPKPTQWVSDMVGTGTKWLLALSFKYLRE